jgi:hypothetical protein
LVSVNIMENTNSAWAVTSKDQGWLGRYK